MSELIAQGLDDVCRLAEARTGLVIAGPSRASNLVRLESARDAVGCLDWPALAKRLGEENLAGPTWTALIRFMSIGETYFFRNKPHFDLLREQLQDDGRDRGREILQSLAGRHRLPRDMAVNPLHGIGGGERQAAGEHFIQRDA